MTPTSQTPAALSSSGSTVLLNHASEPEPGKKSHIRMLTTASDNDIYPSASPSSTPMMMSSAYTPANVAVFPSHASTALSAYTGASLPYTTSMNQRPAGNGTVLSAPPPSQFIHSALGPPSPATVLGSPFSTPQFSNLPPYASHMPSPQISSSSQQTARTIYIGNFPHDASISDLLDLVKSGSIDTVRPFPEKNCVFITFVEVSAASHFYHEATTKNLALNGTELRIGWGRPSSTPANIQMAIQNGASRNVFLGSLDPSVTEQSIRDQLSQFGQIEHIKLMREKQIAFVHFLSIASAMKCVSVLPTQADWALRRVNYGRDRCAPASTSGMGGYLPQPIYSPAGFHNPAFHVRFPSMPYDPYAPVLDAYPGNTASVSVNGSAIDMNSALSGVANRTIYLGNIHPDATCEEICNVIRGGILSQIRYFADKHIAFVTFVDPNLALQFHNMAVYQGLSIKNRRLKIGWGKASALPPAVIVAIRNGGSRNVYVGNMDDSISEEKLRRDFSDFGEIELINSLQEKNCAFVNFTSIAAAARAIEGIRSKEEYKRFRINYGKDRCGNPPRSMQQQSMYPQPHMHEPLTPTTPSFPISMLMGHPATDTLPQDFDDPTSSSASSHDVHDPVHGVLETTAGLI